MIRVIRPVHTRVVDGDIEASLVGYDIIHIAAHADELGVLFADDAEVSMHTSLPKLAEFFARHPGIKCVVISGCDALAQSIPLASLTVGMTAEISNAASVEFSRGFYDAIGAGRSIEDAVEEGKSSVTLKGHACPVKVVRR